jgi:hypothetical protein
VANLDLIITAWAKDITKKAKRFARGTDMQKTLKYKVKNGLVVWSVINYGLFQNSGVRGSVRTIAKVGKAQKEAMELGISNRKYKYTTKRPPTRGTKLSYPAATEIFITGFPSRTPSHFRWLSKAFKNSNKELEKRIVNHFENLI